MSKLFLNSSLVLVLKQAYPDALSGGLRPGRAARTSRADRTGRQKEFRFLDSGMPAEILSGFGVAAERSPTLRLPIRSVGDRPRDSGEPATQQRWG